MKIGDTNVLFEGTLVIAPCDTPAAHWLGGFKEVVEFIISKKVPVNEAKLINFLRLVQMTFLGTTPCCTRTTAGMLAQLIFDHHTNFRLVCPRVSITPKMHYCVHLQKKTEYGGQRNHWCMVH